MKKINPSTEYGITREEHDDRIILRAAYFTVSVKIGAGKFHTTSYSTLVAALNASWRNPQALVYAVGDNGLDALIPREKWKHYLLKRGEVSIKQVL